MTVAEGRSQLAPKYNPAEVERKWYAFWQENGYFRPDMNSDAEPFCITIPPPNVTGDLHMGHALTYGIEDILGRYKRMRGFNTLIVPGMDHAGIATQNVVEKQLAKDGLTRHQLGREAFVERVWQWKETYADKIRRQFEALGASFDWNRERFTFDPGYVDAVLEFFIRLYEEGQIYKGWRVINWCPRCNSAISDIEVEDVEREDRLYYLRYPLTDGSGDIVVATVRPETILGDVAVAVNPADERYAGLVGKTARLPLVDRELQIVADEMVDMQFGTGAVKITPAHDFNDFEVAQRHDLPMPIAIGPDGEMTEIAGPYAGENVKEARQSVLRDLEAGGFLVKVEPYSHRVPTCERCGTVLEPLLSEQWFMRMEELARPAIEVVKAGRVRFVPERWERVYLDWMENIRPWTLSRQLWWGHRIPIYYCENGHAVAAKSWPEACSRCGGKIVRQDEDVLDTWFSSALWPFAVMGWPMETRELGTFYPTSFMNTSSQILYLWIARMIMIGLKFMHDIPFPVVLINPTILTKSGQRMSKSLGTGIDPLDLIATYGADALRFGLVTSGSTLQQEIRFSPDRVEQARNFANKLWNIARFILSNQVEGDAAETVTLRLEDRWILSRLDRAVASATSDMERYEFSGAGQTMEDFVWSELADWYVEMAKLRLNSGEEGAAATARAVLWSVLDRAVRLLQPYMPFIAEELWQQLRLTGSPAAYRLSGYTGELPRSVMIAPWPEAGAPDDAAEREMELVMEIVRSVRATRSEYRVEPARFVPAQIAAGPNRRTIQGAVDIISRLARLQPVEVFEGMPEKPEHAVALLVEETTVYLPLAGLTDVSAERARLEKEIAETEKQLQGTAAKLNNVSFVSRAPEQVVARERERAGSLNARLARLRERLDMLG